MGLLVNRQDSGPRADASSFQVDVAALAEPMSVAWHAVRVSGMKKGDTALVIGAGPIGAMVTRYVLPLLATSQASLTRGLDSVLKARGASWVGVSEPTATRAGIATACGADVVYNPMECDVVAEVRKATGGGVDVVRSFSSRF